MSREWTPKEEQMLCRLAMSGTPRKSIAEKVGRTLPAIVRRLYRLGVVRQRQRPKGELMRLVEEQCQRRVTKTVLGKRVTRRLYDWEIALELGIESVTVAHARHRLGIPSAREYAGSCVRGTPNSCKVRRYSVSRKARSAADSGDRAA